ncbi:TetR/AcrR family transcriptional regulator [Neobacillus soli]|uniref:TetR/AcrR family transcriptional regulator n=1 Tax=Neobacillus soli TaxID=220688 RepID=UPI0008245553|nr:TetR/AcrR family transcriptional regulator [Neobacillus soli]
MSDREDFLVGEFPFVPKQERALIKRNALLESGHTLFISRGYEQTTAKEIAAHAGVATGTFYRYFSDKRQLLMSLLEDKLDKLLPPEPSWLSGDPQSLLASLLVAHNKRLNELGLHRVLPELALKDSELAEILGAARRKIHARILSSLKQASEKGLTWRDLDLDTVSWAIMVLVENSQEKEARTGKLADYQEISKVICRMVFPPEVLSHLRNIADSNGLKC